MDAARLDLVLQYVLAAAGQEDFGQRELGPIHLIKYAYLADLTHAERHGGETFTGVPWRFFHFGPWALEVNDRIEQAAAAVNAERRTFTSARYEGEFVRYLVPDDALYERLARQLPAEISSAVKRVVHEYGNDTYSLLNHVYLTRPMLSAAPGELLVFEGGEAGEPEAEAPRSTEVFAPLTWKERRTRKEALAKLRERVRARLEERRQRPAVPVSPPPRYDDVFFEGVKWLDHLGGEPVEPLEAEAAFSEDIWKSPTRGGRGVS